MPLIKTSLLIGYGSVGQYHARILHGRYERLVIIDINENARAKASAEYPKALVLSNIAELENHDWDWAGTLAVIANWGPDHETTFLELVRLGIKAVLCEKPLANSVAAGTQMIGEAEKSEVTLGVHHHHRYSGFVSGINSLAEDLELGAPCSVIMHGGALCTVTNGIHYIDLISELFGKGPDSVISTVTGDPINPRSKDLMFYGGTTCWSFGEKRELVMSFSNLSSLSLLGSIYYRHTVIHMARNLEIEICYRNKEEIQKFPAITRVGLAKNIIFKGSIPGIVPLEERTKSILNEIESGKVSIFPARMALEALGACIGALTAGIKKSSVLLPIDPQSEEGQRKWPIS
ncbi:MAG: Gfo/Idh/MocA family oxidoreductase [Candidatus Omnitrophica bacterium]|nr:Gfo/Idh/MocA family oxidoreductase [Candidatus Omnitrophota bacterium]